MQASVATQLRRGGKAAIFVTAVALALMFTLTPTGGATDTKKLQQRLDELVATGVPGAILLMHKGDKTVRLTSGYSNLKGKTHPCKNDRFRVGGLTKTFLSAVILELVGEEGSHLTMRSSRGCRASSRTARTSPSASC